MSVLRSTGGWRRHAPAALRLLLAAVLLLSGAGKLLDAAAAEKVLALLADHDLFRAPWSAVVIRFVSYAELVLAALLVSGWHPRLALAGFSFLVSLFTLALLSLPLRGIPVPECGCFGALVPSGSLPMTLTRNLVLLALAAAGTPSQRRSGRA